MNRKGGAIIQNVQIAVVDYERMTRDFIVDVMTFCVNRQVLTFENTDSIINFLDQGNNIHVLMVSTAIPDHGGFDLLKIIKKKYPQIYFIAMSDNPDDQSSATALGADVFLAKPFELRDLFKIVQQYIVDDAKRADSRLSN